MGTIFLLVAVIIAGWVYFMGIPSITRDENKYGKWDKYFSEESLLIFPKSIEEAEDPEYYFYTVNGLFGRGTAVYLKCKYSPEKYNLEMERIKNIQATSAEGTMGPYYDQELFHWPAYVASFMQGEYEYVLCLEEECTLVYVYMRKVDQSEAGFEQKYYPIIETEPESMGTRDKYYNMYGKKIL